MKYYPVIRGAVEKALTMIAVMAAAFLCAANVYRFSQKPDVSASLALLLLLMVLAYAAFFLLVMRIVSKLHDTGRKLLVVFCILCAFVIQLANAFYMQLDMNVDLSHIYAQCVSMLEENTLRITDVAYFSFYPNNIPINILIYWVFRFGRALGCENYRLVGGLFNTFMLQLLYFSAYRMFSLLTTSEKSTVLTLYFVSNPVLFAYSSYYYTDTISISLLFAGCCLILAACLKPRGRSANILRLLFGGLLVAFACSIRITSIFIVIAAVLWLLFYPDANRREVGRRLIVILAGALLFLGAKQVMYNLHVDFDTRENAVPSTHFLMMGASETGKWNGRDVAFTKSFDAREERTAATLQEWKARLKERGIVGTAALVVHKEALVWADPQKNYKQYTENVVEDTLIYEMINGVYSAPLHAYMQVYNFFYFFILTVSLILLYRKPGTFFFILVLYFCGALLFTALWEAHTRHSLTYMIMMTPLFIPLLSSLSNCIIHKNKR